MRYSTALHLTMQRAIRLIELATADHHYTFVPQSQRFLAIRITSDFSPLLLLSMSGPVTPNIFSTATHVSSCHPCSQEVTSLCFPVSSLSIRVLSTWSSLSILKSIFLK